MTFFVKREEVIRIQDVNFSEKKPEMSAPVEVLTAFSIVAVCASVGGERKTALTHFSNKMAIASAKSESSCAERLQWRRFVSILW